MSIVVVRGGMQSTIQDLGRYGCQKYGIVVSGAMDKDALRIGNMLVGNKPNEAALEITMIGPVLRFTEDTLIAVTGGDLQPQLDGRPLPMGRPVAIAAGASLRFGRPVTGCRAYVCVSGGFDVPLVMNSKSTYLRAALGGYQGRALQKNDEIGLCGMTDAGRHMVSFLKSQGTYKTTDWYVMEPARFYAASQSAIRITKGLQYDWFAPESKESLVHDTFTITVQADRMGYRLQGGQLHLETVREMISEPAVEGSIQVPAGGEAIILMADHQTVAGYPKIGQVAMADMGRLAQCKPGEPLHFSVITTEEAETLWLQREEYMQHIAVYIQCKFSL